MKIKWYDFRNTEPPRRNEYYVIMTAGGNVYFDKWIREPFESWEGHTIECKWENTHRGYVEKWAFVDDFTLGDYIDLNQNGLN